MVNRGKTAASLEWSIFCGEAPTAKANGNYLVVKTGIFLLGKPEV
jgi:hypothetical protein